MAYGTAPYGDAAYGQDSQEGAQPPAGLAGLLSPTEQAGQVNPTEQGGTDGA